MHPYVCGAVFLVCAACGSVGDMAVDGATGSDGRVTDGGVVVDGAVDPDADVADAEPGPDAAGVACDVTKPFGTPVLIPGVNSSNHERWGVLSADELTLYFSDFSANHNVMVATRSSPTGTFSTPIVMPGAVNTPATEEHPAVTADGLILVADTDAFGTGTADIGLATRASTAQDFGPLLSVSGINTPSYHENSAWISADGLTLLFGSNRLGDFGTFQATRPSVSTAFGAPTFLAELDAGLATDAGAVLSADGLEIFFYSDRGFTTGPDIWRATRATPSGPFGAPVKVSELSSDTQDLTSWLSPDRCRLLFSSNRLGSHDLFMATRPL